MDTNLNTFLKINLHLMSFLIFFSHFVVDRNEGTQATSSRYKKFTSSEMLTGHYDFKLI